MELLNSKTTTAQLQSKMDGLQLLQRWGVVTYTPSPPSPPPTFRGNLAFQLVSDMLTCIQGLNHLPEFVDDFFPPLRYGLTPEADGIIRLLCLAITSGMLALHIGRRSPTSKTLSYLALQIVAMVINNARLATPAGLVLVLVALLTIGADIAITTWDKSWAFWIAILATYGFVAGSATGACLSVYRFNKSYPL